MRRTHRSQTSHRRAARPLLALRVFAAHECVVTRARSSRARRVGSTGCRPRPEVCGAMLDNAPAGDPAWAGHDPLKAASPTARWTGCRKQCSSCRMRPCRRSWTPLREHARCWQRPRSRSRMCRWHRRTGSTPTSGSRTGSCWRPRHVVEVRVAGARVAVGEGGGYQAADVDLAGTVGPFAGEQSLLSR